MSAIGRRGPRSPRRERAARGAQAPPQTPEDGQQLAERFFTHSAAAFALVSPDLRFVKVNAALCELVGRSESELLGAPTELVFPAQPDAPGVVEQALADPAGRVSVERELLRPDGEEIWVRLDFTAIRDGAGEPLFYAGTAQDVTRERTALEQLDRERDELAEAEAIAQVGYWRLRLATGEPSCSTQMRRIFEVPADAPLDVELFLARVPEQERHSLRQHLLRARDEALPFEWQHRIVRGDGSEGYVHWRGHLVERGGERWLVGTAQDVSEQMQAEHAAAEATERFVTAFEDAPIGMSILGTDGVYLQVNPALCALLGYSREQLLERSFESVTHPDDLQAGRLVLDSLVGGERPTARYEKRFLHADGHPIWATVAVSLVRDEVGEPLYLVAQVEDVSERKRAEQAAAEATKRFQNAFSSAPMGMALAGLDGTVLDVNPALCAMAGFTREQFLEKRWHELTHPDDLESGLQQLADLVGGRTRSFQTETRFIRADGVAIWTTLAVSLVRSEDGEPLYFVAHVDDMTERREMARAAAEAAERFRNAFENAPIGMALGRLDGVIIDANPSLVAMSGYSREQLLRMRWQDVCDPEGLERGTQALAELAAGKRRSYQVEWRFLRADGGFAWTSTSVSVVRGENDEPLYFVVQIDDVTERREAARAAAEAAERFRKAFENAPVGMALVHLDGTVFDVNPALVDMGGYTRQQLLGMRWQDACHPDDLEFALEQLAALVEGRSASYQVELRLLRADGDVRWTTTSVSLVRDEEGEPLYIVVQIDDVTERRAMARAAAEASERFRGAFENSPIGMSLSGPDGSWLQVNQALCEMLGYSREQLLGTTFQAVTHPEDLQASNEELKRLTNGEVAAVQFEKRYLHADGHVVWVILSTSLVRDEEGEPLYFVTQMVDVSERRRAERALAEAMELFAQAFENAPVGMALTKVGGELLQVNQALCDMLGYEREQLLSTTLLAITHPDDVELSHREFGALYGGQVQSCRFEKRYLHADGHDVWALVSASVIRDEHGQPSYLVNQMLDISERRRLDDLLRRNAALLEEAQELTQVGSFEWDLEKREMRNSRELHRIHGTDPDTFVPTLEWLISVVHEEDRGRMSEAWRTHSARPSETFRIIRSDGAVRHLVTHARIQRDETGKPVSVFGAVQDVTERIEAEAARLELEARMQEAQRLESLGVLAGGIAHDFNNLLVGVLGNAGLAALELPPHSPARLLIDQVEIAARRAAELTKQMLAYSGRGQFVVQPLDLRAVVREMSALLETVIPKHVVVDYDFARELPAVRADVAQIRQLVMNLITNAADAIGEEGGRIELRVAQRHADAAFLSGYSLSEGLPEGTYVTLDVRDDGTGMDPETLSRIFDPFFTTKFSGHGLGLAAALGIVRGHHGGIRVESEKGRGSCFSLVLPAVEDEVERAGAVPEAPHWKATGTVLVVDDEEIVRRAAQRILTSSGLAVVEAATGAQALKLFAETSERVDVALVDLVMPGMSGEELVRALRKLRPELPVVVTSGYDARALVDALGARTEFLQKPYHPRDLLECMRRSVAGG